PRGSADRNYDAGEPGTVRMVAPLAGARIETATTCARKSPPASLPSRERGSKPQLKEPRNALFRVVPSRERESKHGRGRRQRQRDREACVMLLRLELNHCCEVVGRVSAIVAFVCMALFIVAATAVDVLR